MARDNLLMDNKISRSGVLKAPNVTRPDSVIESPM
jgi:hypothetical protein